MNHTQVDYLAILDFEATCMENKKISPQEIIEFPIVLIDTKTYETVDKFQQYIKPIYHPKLTAFCTSLTGIEQKTIDEHGVDFKTALNLVKLFLQKHGLLDSSDKPKTKSFMWVTCGNWDLNKMLPEQCSTAGMDYVPKYFRSWCNMKEIFERCYPGQYKTGMIAMLKYFKLPLIGRHHSGIDDCVNIGRICVAMMKQNKKIEITNSFTKPKK